jgi:hypothetical protein
MAPGGGAEASASPRHRCQHCLSLGAVEPAAVFQLGRVAGDVQALRFRIDTDHQGMRHRPWLAGMVAHAADLDAGFLHCLPPHRILHGFARFDETGQTGIHAGREMRAASEQASVARLVDGQHDRHRVCARKHRVAATLATPPVSAGFRRHRLAAAAAMPVGQGPGHQAGALRIGAKSFFVHQGLPVDRACVDRLERLGQVVGLDTHRHGNPGHAGLVPADQHRIGVVRLHQG